VLVGVEGSLLARWKGHTARQTRTRSRKRMKELQEPSLARELVRTVWDTRVCLGQRQLLGAFNKRALRPPQPPASV
jgi:hypothetical protein